MERTIAQTEQYEIATEQVGAFVVARLRGRYADEMLTPLRNTVLRQDLNYLIDASSLGSIAMPLAREIYFTAQRIRKQSCQIALLRPPEKLMDFLKLLTSNLPMVIYSEDQLTFDAAETASRAADLEKELVLIRENIQSNPLWQYIDREGSWLCPYCARLLDDTKIALRVNVSGSALNKIHGHLRAGCPLYDPDRPKYRPRSELDILLRKINREKRSATRQHVAIMESRMSVLEDKVKKAEAFEHSLSIASARQKRLLPDKPPVVSGFEARILYRSSEKVSGDFYDFVELADGRIGFLIGDVAGHGIEAAVLMGMAKKVLSLRMEELVSPLQVLQRANKDLFRELDRQSFVTAFVALLDPKKKTLQYARAGHNPPLLFNAEREHPVSKLEGGGLGLGISQGPIFEKALQEKMLELRSGDVILFYTDGLVEARNAKEEEFGISSVAQILEQTKDEALSSVLGTLGYKLDRFTQDTPQEDDITAVCMKAL